MAIEKGQGHSKYSWVEYIEVLSTKHEHLNFRAPGTIRRHGKKIVRTYSNYVLAFPQRNTCGHAIGYLQVSACKSQQQWLSMFSHLPPTLCRCMDRAPTTHEITVAEDKVSLRDNHPVPSKAIPAQIHIHHCVPNNRRPASYIHPSTIIVLRDVREGIDWEGQPKEV